MKHLGSLDLSVFDDDFPWRFVPPTRRPVSQATYLEDDWNRFHADGSVESHELCLGCEPDGTCPFHPPGCGCSDGACREVQAMPGGAS